MSKELEKTIKSLSNLKQNKKKDRIWLESQAKIILWKKEIDIASRFFDKEDKKLAIKFFDNYLENYEFGSYDDIQNVADLVYEQVLKQRIQETISKKMSDVSNTFIPDKAIQNLHSIKDRILELKEKAGISVTKDKDALNALEEYQKKLEVYIPFHRNEFETEWPTICKKCGFEYVEMHLLRRRCNKDNFTHLIHPFFSGRYLFNTEIMNDYRDGKISVEQAARFMRTSPAYIVWADENRYKIVEIEGVEKERVDEFINKNPFVPLAEEQNKKKI